MRHLSMPLLLIALMCVPLAVCAQVYKWKDAHGTVHFSDTPPPHGIEYTRVKTVAAANHATPRESNPPAQEPADSTNDATDSRGRMADTPENRKKLCTDLTANIKLLKSDSPIVTRDSDGKSQVMDKDRRAGELAREQKQYQQFCQ